ncbi:hypothetical protein AB0H28_13410 [Micromonospora sp. NPDC050980]|uniref:hypothetical protein n=1 Tax=Micromonospora sp. NPDC050980 TaxID=3155161 RepID=UPI0033E8D327
MTGQLGLAFVLLTGAAVAVAWPVRAGRVRRRAVLDPGEVPGDARPVSGSRAGGAGRVRGSARPSTVRSGRPPGRLDRLRRPVAGLGREHRRWAGPGGHPRGRRPELAFRPPTTRPEAFRESVLRAVDSTNLADESRATQVRARLTARRALPVAAVFGGGVGALLGGPVAALVLGAYGTLAARATLRRRAQRAAELAHRRDLDRLAGAAADLRAGLPAGAVLDGGTGRLAGLCRAAVRLADRTGAPLADLLERIEADARAADRGLAAAAAQAAGARATAWLLAGLPLGGIGLGYAIGVDPVAVLLHTPVGGASALAAVVLQSGGLLWAERLGAGPGRAS